MDSDQTNETADGSGAQAANGCEYNGQAYSPGAIICVNGWELQCTVGSTWEQTGHKCRSDGGADGGTDAGGATGDGQGQYA